MPQDDLIPTGLPEPQPRPRRFNRRHGFLMAGLTGLVVTAPGPGLEGLVPASAPIEVFEGEEAADPAPLFELPEATRVAHRADAGAGGEASALVSAVREGRSAVARWDGVRIFTEGGRTELVGFHESNNASALPLNATGPIAKSHHHGVSIPTTGEADGQVIVLPTRQRASGPMTAIDLAVQRNQAVVSPVDGTVVSVDPIQYEGADNKIVIRPHDNPDVQVSIIHVEDPLVEPGDRVRGGETSVAAAPRQLHFESQVDRFTEAARGAAAPHVHIEMRAVSEALA